MADSNDFSEAAGTS